ncbi:MEDS domain-containing protein [Solwaraspora sp. WMMB335]|uniref:MEDS domain-containing protein n=1 Tax=Solwaraspora sp. WMMB335 TaxID=3404118 RepID=UPI003B965F98
MDRRMADPAAVGAIGAGDHACLTFSDQEERLDLVAAFVRGGLRAGHKVVCWTDSVSPDELTGELHDRAVRPGSALRRGQLRISTAADSLLGGAHDAASMVETLTGEVRQAGREGYPGLRITADMCWATRPLTSAEQLLEFETRVTDLFAHGQLCLICQYDRERFDAVTLAFAARAHPKTVAAQVYLEHPLLRICRQYSPGGVRIAGELDFRHADVLELALAESLRIDRHVRVNLAALDYIDGACAAIIVAAARSLPKSRRMTVTCRRLVGTVLSLVGADGVAALRVQRCHDQP